jgi:hypothetical protein
MSVALTGLSGGGPNEDRAVASLQVEHNEQTYDWAIYIPVNLSTDLGTYIQSQETKIYADIDKKEADWAALTPKTREVERLSPFNRNLEKVTVDIPKSEIVRPNMPDYYANRRAEYPSIAEQLDALWKGGNFATEMANKISAIKLKYPKS